MDPRVRSWKSEDLSSSGAVQSVIAASESKVYELMGRINPKRSIELPDPCAAVCTCPSKKI
jgi:hypothetical protein